jgi:hypothetical protein
MSSRQPNWDLDKLRGEEGEQLVAAMRSAVIAGTCEVKTDAMALRTGNVYVEYACKTSQGWMPSGIATTKAASWAFVLGRTVVWMPTWALKNVARGKLNDGKKKECATGSHPTKGVLVPVKDLVPLSIAQYVTEPERQAA